MMITKTTASIVGIAAIVLSLALSSVFIANQAYAAKTTTTNCEKPNGSTSGACSGNSGTNGNDNQCQTSVTKAGNGKGSGEIKDSSGSC
jgi:hypothetical protein